MRISTSQMQSSAVRSMLDRQSEMSYTQQQVATGKRILSPSDDIVGSVQVIAFQQSIATQVQYQRNTDVAEGRLASEETALIQAVDVLQRVRELAIQGNSNTQTAESRAAISFELRQNLDQILSLANTVDGNGEYVFAGNNVGVEPFTAVEMPVGSGLFNFNYAGDSGQRNLQIGATRQIPVGDPGSDVFVNAPVTAGGTLSIFDTVEQLALDMENNTVSVNAEADLKMAIDHLGGFIARVGGRQNAISSERQFSADMQLEAERRLSDVQDLDYTEAISRLTRQMTGLEAAQKSFSVIQNLSLFNYL